MGFRPPRQSRHLSGHRPQIGPLAREHVGLAGAPGLHGPDVAVGDVVHVGLHHAKARRHHHAFARGHVGQHLPYLGRVARTIDPTRHHDDDLGDIMCCRELLHIVVSPGLGFVVRGAVPPREAVRLINRATLGVGVCHGTGAGVDQPRNARGHGRRR